jgi:hypothetical protein
MTTQTSTQTDGTRVGYDDGSWHGGNGNFFLSQGASIGVATSNAISFDIGVDVPAGSTVTAAYFRPYLTNTGTAVAKMRVACEAANPTGNTTWGSGHRPVGASFGSVLTAASDWGGIPPAYNYGPSDTQSLDIHTLIQTLVNTYSGLQVGDIVNLGLQHDGTGFIQLGDPNSAGSTQSPQLIITWTPPAGGVIAPIGSIMTGGMQELLGGMRS